MELVLDSNIVNLILKVASQNGGNTTLDPHIAKRKLNVMLDHGGAIRDEWCRTCGDEYVRQLVIHWSQWDVFQKVPNKLKIPHALSRALRQLGFGDDAIDKIILRTAFNCGNVAARHIISHDSDFWNPKQPGRFGNQSAPVAKLCRECMKIRITSFPQLIAAL